MNKTEFLHTLRARREALEARLAGLSADDIMKRDAPDRWSLKDTLAHLVYWEQYMLERVIRAVYHNESPQWVTNEEETQLNAQVFEENKDRPVAEVVADVHSSMVQVVEQLEALSEEDLTDPQRFAWMKGKPLWRYIADETYGEHFHEHLGDLMPEPEQSQAE